MNYIRHVVALCMMLMTIGISAEPVTPEQVKNPREVDSRSNIANPDNIIGSSDCLLLQSICDSLYAETGVELCVVALDDIGDADAFEFSVALFNRWGVGNRGSNTGMLIFLTRQQRDFRIVTGEGVEGVFPDILCDRIIDMAIDSMRSTGTLDYGTGLVTASREIRHLASDEDAREELLSSFEEDDDDMDMYGVLGIYSLMFGGLIAGAYFSRKKCPKCGKRKLQRVNSNVLLEPTRWKTGLALNSYVCKNCGHSFDEEEKLPLKSDDRGYRGGAFGGGSFGGGRGFGGGSFGGGHSFGGGAGRKF